MDARDAIARAKTYVAEVFADDKPRNIGLEEIRFDEDQKAWLITVGFSRPWDAARPYVTALGQDIDLRRTYKVVRVGDADGAIVSLTNRTFEATGS